uniref:AN1-type domain-containing protein n=1 Tax=Chenopodium quinoa TaxID=63459 RepID=A0A803MBX0_CHEQI
MEDNNKSKNVHQSLFGDPKRTQELLSIAIEKEIKRSGGKNLFWESIFRANSSKKKQVNGSTRAKITETSINRCGACKKRIKLIGFMCRCGGVYCGLHRYPEVHSCGFDHKALGRHALSKTLHACAFKATKLNYI